MPFDHRQIERQRHLARQFSLAGTGLTLDQQRPFERHRGIDCNGQIVGRHIALGSFEFHESFPQPPRDTSPEPSGLEKLPQPAVLR